MGLGEYAKKKAGEILPVKKIVIYGGGALAIWAAVEVGPSAADLWQSAVVGWDISPVLNDINKIPPLSYLHEWLNGKPDAVGETPHMGQQVLEYSAPANDGPRITLPLQESVAVISQ